MGQRDLPPGEMSFPEPEEAQNSVGEMLSRFFRFGKAEKPPQKVPQRTAGPGDAAAPPAVHYQIDYSEGRSLPNVLKRISNLLAVKNTNLQDYSETDLKQYWMPDSVSRECYQCGEKFTTFRRRHHCRVCGQIFCSKCCNQEVPGKIIGCTGDLRACTYCCKVVLSYLQSPDASAVLTADLRALQEDLQSKFGAPLASTQLVAENSEPTVESNTLRRKISVGYQEEKFSIGRSPNKSFLSPEEKSRVLQNSTSLRNLYDEIRHPEVGVALHNHRYKFRTYNDCFTGAEMVDWLIAQQKSNSRLQASAICHALLEAAYVESLSEREEFHDGDSLYRFCDVFLRDKPSNSLSFEAKYLEEPIWVQQIPQESTDSEAEPSAPLESAKDSSIKRLPSSSSSFFLDINLEDTSVHLSRPSAAEATVVAPQEEAAVVEEPVQTSDQRELVPSTGWYDAKSLRTENGEKAAYEALGKSYIAHEEAFARQLLAEQNVPPAWLEIILRLAKQIVDVVRPDLNRDAEDMDIRHYVQFKKIPGGLRKDSDLVDGIVCSRNVVHRSMSAELKNPQILLLECPLVYQRTEGKFLSLEAVMLQEPEYLRNVTARIAALRPDVVMVHRNVSRLAQELLREHNITLVLNVKLSTLERLARCTGADIVTTVDAQVARPRLGTCRTFRVAHFDAENGVGKTLLFFEGLPHRHLGATVLLRGAPRVELARAKAVASAVLFARYNWRLEKSFLMDELAGPPDLEDAGELADDLGPRVEAQPTVTAPRPATAAGAADEQKKAVAEAVSDFSDPLHSSAFQPQELEDGQPLSVHRLPAANRFREALDGAVLSISPHFKFGIPFLETEQGKRCKLRRFYPDVVHFSKQLVEAPMVRSFTRVAEATAREKCRENCIQLKEQHPFVSAQLYLPASSNEVQSLLADFRASGGRYQLNGGRGDAGECEEARQKGAEEGPPDVLDPANHQRIAVLFCSFSPHSANAPAFCVNPWVVDMSFYGRYDISLGCFLKRYCFRPTYTCRSDNCETPMLQHTRRFVHDAGCVSVTLSAAPSSPAPGADDGIAMWSWCCRCRAAGPAVLMSPDTWSYSFAKYLEMRFHGHMYALRRSDAGVEGCTHSLHRDHCQYFAHKNTVASFKYTSVQLWEVSLPPSLIHLEHDLVAHQATSIAEVKTLASSGFEVFSVIIDKLAELAADPDTPPAWKQHVQKDNAEFKARIEEAQLKLTQPWSDVKNAWQHDDVVVLAKQWLARFVRTWNSRFRNKEKHLSAADGIATPLEPEVVTGQQEATSSSEANTASESEEVFAECRSQALNHSEDNSVPESPKSRQKLQSTSQAEETDGKKESSDKKSVKNILSQLLPSSSTAAILQCPFNASEHYLLPPTSSIPLVVNEAEPSSIIAYALNSLEYKRRFEEFRGKQQQQQQQQQSQQQSQQQLQLQSQGGDGHAASPQHNRHSAGPETSELTSSTEKSSRILSFLRPKSESNISPAVSIGDISEPEDVERQKSPDVEVQFEDGSCKFFCRIYFAELFFRLRQMVLPIGEEGYVRSLARSVPWNARGGKSGSSFCKTKDDRFILKEMSRQEVQQILDSARSYFGYVVRCHQEQLPTLLGKIVGVYNIVFTNAATNASMRSTMLVMENLFYNRSVSHKFDLKGSMRNRLVDPDNHQEGEIVLLDENLLKRTCESPLYIFPHSKQVLTAAIHNDTKFLSSQCVMDYSLLVGLDTENKELVVGIIDYIRTFTWDKKLETIVKKSLGGQGKLPTIVSPEKYQERFIDAMHKYFLEVPDRWSRMMQYPGQDCFTIS